MLKEMFKKTKYISLDNYIKEKEKVLTNNKEVNTELDDQIENEAQIKEDYNNSLDRCPAVPDGMWIKCDICGEVIYCEDIHSSMNCCPKCNFHFRITASKRLYFTIDDGSFVEWDKNKSAKNVLDFPGYEEKIKDLQLKTGMVDAVITGEGKIGGYNTAIAIMDSYFMMGSMGQVVGEKITRAIEKATKKKLPIIICSTSGGARMQEGIISLMQMAKTSAALQRHHEAGLLYISILTDPTTGGVTASFAMLGDIIIAEPGALIGFAGPRVIEQTIGQKLPEGFQRAEFLLDKGFVDRIVKRKKMKDELSTILKFHHLKSKIEGEVNSGKG